MTVIIDYGVGNLFSLRSSFAAIGEEAKVSSDIAVIESADRLILPGVGAFGDAADKLRKSGLFDTVKSLACSGKPILGICLGMQLLFERSYEYGTHEGLGLLHGEIKPLSDFISPGLDIPHMGWNSLEILKDIPLTKSIKNGDFVYFVHSYAATDCRDSLIATADYSAPVTAIVAKDNIMGTQFHPEKSGETGLSILKEFCRI